MYILKFVIYSHITFFLKVPFRFCFRKVFWNLPDSFRDSVFSTFVYFLGLFLFRNCTKTRVCKGTLKVTK